MSLKDSKSLVLDLINTDNGTPYQNGWLNYGPVVILPEGHESQRQVSVHLTPTEISGRKGERTIYYNRLDLTQLFNNTSPQLTYAALTSTQDVLDILNEVYDTQFTTDDIEVQEFGEGVPQPLPEQLTLVALDGSYAFVGELVVGIEQQLIDLVDEIVVTHLNGLLYPPGNISSVMDPVVDREIDLPTNAVASNGMMFLGNSNQVHGFTVANNAEIALGVVCRVKGQGTTPPVDENGISQIQLPAGSAADWNIHFSVSLLGAAIGSCITDLYNVKMIYKAENGDFIAFDLVEDAVTPNKLNWDITTGEGTITDSYSSASGDVTQNIQRVFWYDTKFQNTPVSVFGKRVGKFEILLVANRKDAIVKTLICSHKVNITPAPVV